MNKKLLFGIAVLVIGVLSTLAANSFLVEFFPVRPIVDDFFFRLLPKITEFSYVADGAVTAGILVALVTFRKNSNKLALYAFCLGLLYIIRAAANVLTPLGDPSGDAVPYGFLELSPMLGMFPSGHIGSIGASFFLTRFYGAKKAMWTCVGLLVVEFFALIVTRGHYSIDIFAGLLLSYAVYRFALWMSAKSWYSRLD